MNACLERPLFNLWPTFLSVTGVMRRVRQGGGDQPGVVGKVGRKPLLPRRRCDTRIAWPLTTQRERRLNARRGSKRDDPRPLSFPIAQY